MLIQSNPSLLTISLKWNTNMISEMVINTIMVKVEKCYTFDKNTQKKQRTIVSRKSVEQLITYIKDKQKLGKSMVLEQPERQFIISVDMCKISHMSECQLIGGGCVSSNNNKRNSGAAFTPNIHNKTEITHLDEICTTDDFLIELTKERTIDLEGEILPYFSNILKREKLDSISTKMLLKVLMYCLEYLLLETRTTVLQSPSINSDTVDKLKKYTKKFQDFFKTNMDKYPLQSHQHVLDWMSLILKFDKKEKKLLASTCSDNDCLIFSTKFENSQTVQPFIQKQAESCTDSDAGDLVDNYSILFAQKNQIFHLIAYRRIIQQNFTSCVGNLPTLMDQILFAYHKSFNRFKSQLSFDARFYSLLTINLLLSSFKDISKNVDLSRNASIYLNTFLFSKQEGIISVCEEEFKLSQNQHNSNECVKTFMSHHQSFRFIASDILRNLNQILSKYLPKNSYYEEQQNHLNDLIKLRQSQEKSACVKIIFSENNFNSSPTSHHAKKNLKLE